MGEERINNKAELLDLLKNTLTEVCSDKDNQNSKSSEFTNLIGKHLIRMGVKRNLDIIPEFYTLINDKPWKIDFVYFDKNRSDHPLIVIEHEQGSLTKFNSAIRRLDELKAEYKPE